MARPKGSTTKPKITDFVSKEEIAELFVIAKEQARKNPIIMKFLLEQVLGKAPQPISNDNGDIFQIVIKRDGNKDDKTIQTAGQGDIQPGKV